MIETYVRAKKAGVPIVALKTADPGASEKGITKYLAEWKGPDGEVIPQLVAHWDASAGLEPLNNLGIQAVNFIADQIPDPRVPDEFFGILKKVRMANLTIFVKDAHEVVKDAKCRVAIDNIRDEWKTIGSQLVLMAPEWILPEELKGSVIVIEEPILTKEKVEEVIDRLMKASPELKKPKDREKMVDALVALPSEFSVEQVASMSVNRVDAKTLVFDQQMIWNQKNSVIEQTPGLKVGKPHEFDVVGGCSSFKEDIRLLDAGPRRFNVVVFIDEIDKFAGVSGGGDSSGTKLDQLGVMLKEMEDNRYKGIILMGPPGTSKTHLARAVAGELGAMLIEFDGGGMQDKYVGESGRKTRQAFRMIKSASQGEALFIATCNDESKLPPELKRRFSDIYYSDIPTAEERKLIWPIHIKAFNLREDQIDQFDDSDWTGAEIRNCCMKAWEWNCTLSKASKRIVPVSKMVPEVIEALRKRANGRYLSVNHEGTYQSVTMQQPWAEPASRKLG